MAHGKETNMNPHFLTGVVGYTRISDEDERSSEAKESRSIEYQRNMIKKFGEERGLSVEHVFVDDGYSGTSFDRPEYQKMKKLIQKGVIKVLIVKDLSRFGRNAAKMTLELENFNDEYGLRFISITEGIDATSTNDYNEVFQFILVMNEMYPRDCSRKIIYSWKNGVTDGRFMFGTPPYGYIRDPDTRLQLRVDPIAARHVRRIFEMYAGGETMRAIADRLNSEGLKSPRAYYYEKKGKDNPNSESASWGSNTIRQILENEAYIGVLIQGKRRTVSYKNKKRKCVPESEWYRHENAHEPIIEDFLWDAVRRRREQAPRTMTRQNGQIGIFSGLLRCGECGSALAYTTANKTTPIYRCTLYNTNGMSACTPHRLYERTLAQVMSFEIQKYAQLACQSKDSLAKMVWERFQRNNYETANDLSNQQRLMQNKLEKSHAAVRALLDDRANGLLPDKIYNVQMHRLGEEQEGLEEELRQITSKMMRKKDEDKSIKHWINSVERHFDMNLIDRAAAAELIELIIVHEVREPTGKAKFELDITYRFVGRLDDAKKDIA